MKDVEALLKEIHDHLGSKSVYSELRGLIREFGNERATLAQLVSAVEKSPAPELISGLEGDGLPITAPTLVLRVEVAGAEEFAGELSDLRTTGEINRLRLHVRRRESSLRPLATQSYALAGPRAGLAAGGGGDSSGPLPAATCGVAPDAMCRRPRAFRDISLRAMPPTAVE